LSGCPSETDSDVNKYPMFRFIFKSLKFIFLLTDAKIRLFKE